METALVKIDPKEFGLNDQNVQEIEQAFLPKIAERDGYIPVFEQLIIKELTPQLCVEAKELRLKLVKVRTGISDIHKTQKAYFLSAGRFVDAWKNKETIPVEQMEEKLAEIEKYFERIEAERLAKIESDRKTELLKYSEVVPFGLAQMDEAVFQNHLTGCRLAYEAKVEAEKKAEAERLAAIEAEKAEQERIRQENIRLQKLAEEKEKQLEKEREEVDKLRIEAEAKARKEREEIEAKAAQERKDAQAKIDKANEESRKLAEEIRLKKEQEEKAEADRKAKEVKELKEKQDQERKLSMASDKEKLTRWVNSTVLPEIIILGLDENSQSAVNIITDKFNAFKRWAESQIESIK